MGNTEDKNDIKKSTSKKENKSKEKKGEKFNDDEVDKFNIMVKRNKSSGKPWYYGLEGNWWWGITEEDARTKIKDAQKAFENILKTPTVSSSKKKEHNIDVKKGQEKGQLQESVIIAQTKENIQKIENVAENISDTSKIDTNKEDIQKMDND